MGHDVPAAQGVPGSANSLSDEGRKSAWRPQHSKKRGQPAQQLEEGAARAVWRRHELTGASLALRLVALKTRWDAENLAQACAKYLRRRRERSALAALEGPLMPDLLLLARQGLPLLGKEAPDRANGWEGMHGAGARPYSDGVQSSSSLRAWQFKQRMPLHILANQPGTEISADTKSILFHMRPGTAA